MSHDLATTPASAGHYENPQASRPREDNTPPETWQGGATKEAFNLQAARLGPQPHWLDYPSEPMRSRFAHVPNEVNWQKLYQLRRKASCVISRRRQHKADIV
jgi:hypothetical protein